MDNLQARIAEVEAQVEAARGQLDQIIAAMEHLEPGIVLYGPDDRVVFCNKRFREIYAEVADLLIPGTSYSEIARAYYRRGFESRTGLSEDEYVRARADYHQNPDERDYEFMHGDKYWLLISDRKTRDGGVIGFRVDITARKRAEQQREASEARFKSLLEMSSDWYWEQDDQYRFTMMSQGLAHLGEVPEKLLGRCRWDLGYGGLTPEQWEAHKHQLYAREPFRGLEFTFTRDTGEVRWVSVTGEPVFDVAGRFVGYRGVGTDVTERKRYETKIRELADYDFLTGLPNRSLLAARFAFSSRGAERSGQPMALVFIDLDRFKTINDSLGHPVGDRLLKQIATRLVHVVRATDTVCRHGGDEFLVLLPEVGAASNAAHVAEEISRELSRPYEVDGYELVVTPSIGISLYPSDGRELPVLIRNADAAMYHSKAMGRNRYSFFKEEMNARISERLTLENGMRRALARDEFFLEYQPVYALGGRYIVGAEALLRWRHPELGVVPPARFIPIAEDSGLILEIGEWVMREACRQSREWAKAGLREMPLRVNLSGIQLRQKNFIEVMQRAMADHGRGAAHLEFEVTESVLITEAEMATGVLEALSRQGLKIAIDDFGTGYSNLSYLKRLRIDKLKIDKSFIRDLAVDPAGAALTQGIVGLAKSLGLRVTAEGVETAAQLEFLEAAGCDEAQGFFFSMPLGADAMAELLRSDA
ncbi:hypothetical protein BWI17_12035 [Betaproteobacteria bacterium GR16-43]|nr:hypothetical protein BWI17_12035 [Betaproteobacteria bacterium GR16-43]